MNGKGIFVPQFVTVVECSLVFLQTLPDYADFFFFSLVGNWQIVNDIPHATVRVKLMFVTLCQVGLEIEHGLQY
jgi:hypothetical protein